MGRWARLLSLLVLGAMEARKAAKLYAALDVAFRQYSTTVFKGVPSSTTSSTASLCRA